jgi:hypothetical protein
MICALQHKKLGAIEEISLERPKRPEKKVIIMVSQVLTDMRLDQVAKWFEKTVL